MTVINHGLEPLIRLREAATALGVSRRYLELQIAAGQLPAVRLGPRLIRVRRSDIAAWLDAHCTHRGVVA